MELNWICWNFLPNFKLITRPQREEISWSQIIVIEIITTIFSHFNIPSVVHLNCNLCDTHQQPLPYNFTLACTHFASLDRLQTWSMKYLHNNEAFSEWKTHSLSVKAILSTGEGAIATYCRWDVPGERERTSTMNFY